jgi:transcriptional regulator with XRE-family HTH domain
MILLRRVIGDALRARRQGQHRTLREVSTAANVSLGYLSEIERGQKEASSELLSSICDALGAQLSEVLREVSDTLALSEEMDRVLVPAQGGGPDSAPEAQRAPTRKQPATKAAPAPVPAPAPAKAAEPAAALRQVATDGKVSVSVRQDTPLKAVLHTRNLRTNPRERDVVCVA